VNILDLAKEKIVIIDGALGTSIHALKLPPEAYGGYPGCNEILNLTRPEDIRAIHTAYFKVGANVVATNTFGGHPLVLAEYDLAARTEEINEAAARIARQAVAECSVEGHPCFVGGSVGPGTKLPSLGQTTYDEIYTGAVRQIAGLIAGGVDLLQFETCQDLLQIKAALAAARAVMAKTRMVPLYVSVTIEQTGTLLTGSDMAAVIAALAPFDIDVLGMNCATGPTAMRPHLEELARLWPKLMGVYPNAGLPMPCADGVCYPETPEMLAATLARFVEELPLNFIGGCCGTTPEHIRQIALAIGSRKPSPNRATPVASLGSLFNAVSIRQDPAPLFVGERANATGSKAFREALLAGDHEQAFAILVEQEEHGSHCADLSVAYAGQDELAHMDALMSRAAKECRLPIFIDSNQPDVVEAALKRYPGRAVINSINLEDGGEKARRTLELARRFGAGVICLTIDEEGMAMTAAKKVAVARRLVALCVDEFGLHPEDLFLDTLTFTVGSGDPGLKTAALETLAAIRQLKNEMPRVNMILGLSNISFGLKLKSRKVLNSVFLDRCLRAGLDAAILNPKHIVPLAELDDDDKRHAAALLDHVPLDGRDPLEAFIDYFAGRADFESEETAADLPPREALRQAIVKGRTQHLAETVAPLLNETTAENILNDILVPAMKHVGELFGAGQMQLPFVLKSAEAMKRAVDVIRPHFTADASTAQPKKLLLATVKGDVHDIGKNLVDIIVSNNGFAVINIGTKVPVETIIAEARRTGADVIGMSGLLVSSALLMAENLRAMTAAELTVPVLVGGAALTAQFTAETLQPAYANGSVTYCADAFAGLTAMQAIAEGRTPEKPPMKKTATIAADALPAQPVAIFHVTPPTPPFRGSRLLENVKLDSIFSLINEVALFRGRWGYRRGKSPKDEYDALIANQVRPAYSELQRIVKAERLFEPRIAYGWFPVRPAGDALLVTHAGREFRFDFPRRAAEPRLCIADFFHPDGDVLGLFVVTLGDRVTKYGQEILQRAGFLDYFMLHGLAVEATDALAEYAHEVMRHELGIGEQKRLDWQGLVTQQYRGSRYAFGYPACPDLAANETLFTLLDAARIGVTLTETWQMTPEFSTSAIVAHHPQAKYFAV